jgi:site-specific DNA-methyltransferase (adenine-specific)
MTAFTDMAEIPRGQYAAIYADPPWTYENYVGQGVAADKYDLMSLADICALPVADLAAKNCALFMWATYPLLPEALEVIRAWGFSYKTNGFTWVKTYQSGQPFLGMGYWTRSNPEICLLATRGKPKRNTKDVLQLCFSQIGRHSAKPEEVAHRIERLVDGPYLELFARRPRRGWDVFGNQIESDLVTNAEAATYAEANP